MSEVLADFGSAIYFVVKDDGTRETIMVLTKESLIRFWV